MHALHAGTLLYHARTCFGATFPLLGLAQRSHFLVWRAVVDHAECQRLERGDAFPYEVLHDIVRALLAEWFPPAPSPARASSLLPSSPLPPPPDVGAEQDPVDEMTEVP